MTPAEGVEQGPRSQYLLRLLWRGKWWVVGPAILLAALAFAHAQASKSVYQGHATVLISRQNLSSTLNNGGSSQQNYQTGEFLQIQRTQAQLAHSPEVAARTLQAVGLSMSPDSLLTDSTVEPDRSSDFISFSVNNSNKVLAQRLATVFAQQYVQYKRELDTRSLEDARASVASKLKNLNPDNPGDKAVFDSISSKEQQLRTLAALQSANASFVRTSDEASAVAPRPKRDTIVGFILGLIAGAIIVVLRDRLDTRVRKPEDISAALGMPLLGFIAPPPRTESDEQTGLVMIDAPQTPPSEAFRVLAVSATYSSVAVDGKVFMVTSAVESEGKSTTIANLAVALARMGNRVALVDLDLRRPTQASLFKVDGSRGVTDIAIGRVPVEGARRPVELSMGNLLNEESEPHLDVYPSGRTPPDPGEFVGSHSIGDLLRGLREEYDFVLVDAPPVLRVGDPLTLAQFMDGIFIVARIGVVKRQMISEMRRVLGRAEVQSLGVIATGTAKWADMQGYGYGYGSAPYGEVPPSPEVFAASESSS